MSSVNKLLVGDKSPKLGSGDKREEIAYLKVLIECLLRTSSMKDVSADGQQELTTNFTDGLHLFTKSSQTDLALTTDSTA